MSEFKMALMLHKLRVPTFVNSLFHRAAALSSVAPLLSLGVQKFQKEAVTSSNFGEKLYSTKKTAEEKEADTRDSNVRRIYVGNLLKGRDCIKEESIFRYFSQYGKVEFLELHRDKWTKLPLGFGFVTFYDAESAKKVLVKADPHTIDGQKVTVAKEFSNRPAVQKRELAVLVNNISKDTSKQAIQEHFSQFGEVDRVILAKKDPQDKSSYYVVFTSLSGAKKALEQSMQKVADQDIDSQVTELLRTSAQNAKKYVGKTKCISITSVPDHLTVEDLRDYFQNFGDVESVDFVVNRRFWSHRDESANVAFVRFSNYTTVEEIVENENHVISGSTVRVLAYEDTGNLASKDLRELKISVKGLPLSMGSKEVQEYFERTFGVVPNGVFRNKLVCIVRLSNMKEVEHVLKQQKGTIIYGQPLYFHRLAWTKPKHK